MVWPVHKYVLMTDSILLIDVTSASTQGLRSHSKRAESQADGLPEPGGEVPGLLREPFTVTDMLPPTAHGAEGSTSGQARCVPGSCFWQRHTQSDTAPDQVRLRSGDVSHRLP